MSKRILYFDWYSAGSEFYRLLPLSYIDNPYLHITRSTETNINFATLSGYDTVIISRPSSAASLGLIKLCKDMHIWVIGDYDDAVLNVDEYNPLYETYIQEKENVIECLTLCDEIWVATEAIKKSFRLYNLNIHVINNAHDDYLFQVAEKRPFTYNKVALYRGGMSHEGDMYDLGVPERIISLVNSNPDWKFKFFGQRFKYLEKRCGKNYIACGGASTVQFYKMIHDENPCIGFYPLADTVFNRGKSNIFWLELTYSGAAVFANKNLPEYNQRGIEDFTDLSTEINIEWLKDMNSISWELIQDKYLLSKVNKIREERLLQ